MDTQEIYCALCKTKNVNLNDACVYCGSLEKEMRLIVEDTITFYEKIRIKTKGSKDFFYDQINGFEPSQNFGLVNKIRIIDKKNDIYFEEIKDEDGVIIHLCEEKLSEHVGHGSAKKKKEE